MKIVDKIQQPDLQIIKALYDKWKQTNKDRITFDAQSYNLQSFLSEIGMSQETAKHHLDNLQSFDFVTWDKDEIKLLPSGIKYSLGQFDHLQ